MSSRDPDWLAGSTADSGAEITNAGHERGSQPWPERAGAVAGSNADRIRPLGRLATALEAERAYWLLWVPVLIGAGIAVYFALPREPAPALGILALITVASMRYAASRMPALRLALDATLLIVLGFVLITMRSAIVDAPILDRRIGPVEVRGYVELAEPREGRGERLTLLVYHLAGMPGDARPQRVRVRAMAGGDGLAPGDAVVLKAHLAAPAAPALPGSFDFARYAYFAGIGAVGYALSPPLADPEAPPPPVTLQFLAGIQRLRRAIGARIDRVLSGETAAIAKALVTGERGGIPEATNAAYRDSGLFHILSISGLHMAIMGGAVFFAVRFMLALVPALALRYPVKKWAALAAAGGSLAYLAISGTTFATLRSFIMISIMFLAILLDRPALALRNVAVSALIILLLFPESLLDVGFQMSFAAVVALVAAYEALRQRGGAPRLASSGVLGFTLVFVGGVVLSTLVASAAVTPFAIYHFHKTQHYGVLANLLAVPICNLVVMPAALATLVFMPLGLESGPLQLMGLGIDAMSATARYVAALPGAVGVVPAIPTHAFALVVAGGLWLALWQGRWRVAGIALLAAGAAIAPLAARPDVLVGRDGRLVAVRADDGRFVAISAAQARFELRRWLEHDGDARSPEQAVAGAGLTCDSVGCVAKVRGTRVAISRHAASVADDCAAADVLVLAVPALGGCTSPVKVIDFLAVRTAGTHALYIDGARQVRVRTVAQERGVRPWSPPHPWSAEGRRLAAARATANSPADATGHQAGPTAEHEFSRRGVARFSAPLHMLDTLQLPRPEVEDEVDEGGDN